MKLEEKSKSELLKEIGDLQHRISELGREKAECQRIAEEKHRLLKRNQLMMRKALDGIVAVDLNGDILEANYQSWHNRTKAVKCEWKFR